MKEKIINQIANWNPQLFREIKGRINKNNLILASFISIIGQFLIYILMQGKLPQPYDNFHRYCVGIPPTNTYPDYYYGNYGNPNNYCVRDQLGNIVHLFHQLWWLDLFITLSIVGIFVLLVGGTYTLIADLSKEENKGTLNFIRLSPQSVKTIFLGKILGVPSIIYYTCFLAIPFHLCAAIFAHIPIHLILVFYLVIIFACAFFYHTALTYSLVSSNLIGFQAFLGSGIVLLFLSITTTILVDSYNSIIVGNAIDWLMIFNPTIFLTFLVDATKINPDTVNYLSLNELQNLQFYKQHFWQTIWSSFGFIIINYSLWTYWLTQGIKRRFHNPLGTLITKKQSYLITICFIIINLGFSLETNHSSFYENITLALFLNLILFLILTAALSPHRQQLQDWVRFRHQNIRKSSLLQELIFGEKSPSILAIALNITITITYFLAMIFLLKINSSPINDQDKLGLFWGIILNAIIAVLYATITQFILYQKTAKRTILAGFTIITMMILPYLILGILNINPQNHWLWLFTPLPIVATKYCLSEVIFFSMITQTFVILVLTNQIKKQLQKAGESETKALLSVDN